MNLNAREATHVLDNSGVQQTNHLCSQYNPTAISSIYDLSLMNLKILETNKYAEIACQAKFEKFQQSTDETSLSAQQIDQINAQCIKELGFLNEEQKIEALRNYNILSDVRSYKTKEDFVKAYTTNLMMSCEVAYNKISKLKNLLNL